MAYSPKSQKEYNQKNYQFYAFKLHKEKDSDMIEHIANAPKESNQEYFKRLIQSDMDKQSEATR